MNVALGQTAQAGSTSDTAITVTDTDGNSVSDGYVTYFIRVITGTLKFGVGSVHADAYGWGAGEDVHPITCFNGNLYFKAAASTDTFVVTTA